MNHLYSICLIVSVTAQVALSDEQSALRIEIIPPKNEAGAAVIPRRGSFSVHVTNVSSATVAIWNEHCEPGYGTLSFRVEEEGRSSVMSLIPRHQGDWRNNPPKTIAIPAGGNFAWSVSPSSIWGERIWKGVPEANTGTPAVLRAVLEIRPGEQAAKHGVWTGRVESEPVSALVVDDKLRTPHDYLDNDSPNQALRLMQKDRTWIGKRDRMEQTPLHIAVHNGHRDAVEWLLEQGASVKAEAYNDFTPLHFASDPEIVKLLIQRKPNLNAECASGTALHEAASDYAHFESLPEYAADRSRLKKVAGLLIEAGARYDLSSAVCLNDLEKVRELASAESSKRDKDAMRSGATYGRAEALKILLDRGADPEEADYGGLTLSYFAIRHPDALKVLLDAGADPKVVVSYFGNGQGPEGSTLLHEAASSGIVGSAKLLVERGVDVNIKNKQGATPLQEACREGHVEMVEWLLDHRASIQDGGIALLQAADGIRPERDDDNARYVAVIRSLQKRGAEITLAAAIALNDVERAAAILRASPRASREPGASGKPALHDAVMLDRREIVKLLLDAGCPVDIRSDLKTNGHDNGTALLSAAFWGRPEIAAILLKKGADANAAADRNVVPLHEAARMGQFKVARLLLQHGADVNARDKEGKTPLDWSRMYHEKSEVIELLRAKGGVPGAAKQ